MFKTIQKIIIVVVFSILLIPNFSFAREPKEITDWYIKDFQSEIIVNKDSTLDITEKITADAGNLPDKHGIFRILPTRFQSQGKWIETPIELISITGLNAILDTNEENQLKYQTIRNSSDHTLTWKIGDPDKTVTGVNYYKIKYTVKNVIGFDNQEYDEFFWNLNGNFWQIETDKFQARIIFPEKVNQNNTKLNYYTGKLGSLTNNLATYNWQDNVLEFNSTQTLKKEEGVSVDLQLPIGVFSPYQPTFIEKYGQYLYFLIPIFVLMISHLLWSKFGRDPKINPTIVPEFEIPENLSPIEMGMVLTDGSLEPKFVTAEIISLAVAKVIQIEKLEKQWFLGGDDYSLKLLKYDQSRLSFSQKALINKLFDKKQEITLSSLKNKFASKFSEISKATSDNLRQKKLLLARSRIMQVVFIVLAVLVSSFTISSFTEIEIYLSISLIITAITLFIFSSLMKIRTLEGAKLTQRIKGFELYMKTAEKYRQQFNEKENIFERFLPYAIMFGITDLWIKKMKMIYGDDYFNTYLPAWYIGSSFGSFDIGSFTSNLNALSSSMNSSMSSSSGGSGGGGGGGGGGGW